MLRQARRISWICTAGEMGALLLEARLIKEQQPLFNKRLRRNRQLCSLQLSEQKIEVVSARSVDFSHEPKPVWALRQPSGGAAKLTEPRR